MNTMDLMMDAADFLVTKPGGITVTEAIAKSLPLIMLKPIPGQEERNAEFIVKQKAGILTTPQRPPAEVVRRLLTRPRFLRKLQTNITRLNPGNSNQMICSFILQNKPGIAGAVLGDRK